MDDRNEDQTSKAEEARPSGVPGPHGLGESKKEVIALSVALVGLVLLAVAFWYESSY